MSTLNPYAEIEKVPLYAPDNMKSRGYSVRLEDDDAESGWKEVGLVGQDYLLVPNRQVREMALEIAGQTGFEWNETKTFFDGKRFVYALAAEEALQAEVAVGDIVGLGMMFENSYDGSRKLGASLYVHRLACSNGMLIPQHFARVRFKHELASAHWEDDARRALSMVSGAGENLQRFADAARNLEATPLGSEALRMIRGELVPQLPITLWGKTVDRYLLHEDLTGWGLLNAGTNVLWHAEKTTMSDFSHNEYLTTQLIEHAHQISAAPALN